jgi:hypothetical protein
VVIEDRQLLRAVPKINSYAAMAAEAPVAILVCGDSSLETVLGYWVIDCSAAVQNLLLAAHALGLGAVWTGYITMVGEDNPMQRIPLRAAIVLLFLTGSTVCLADKPPAGDPPAPLLFTSFRGNGEDGLHLAWSSDGYTWTPLRDDKPLLRPAVGGGLMRDPQILQGPDGTFHMVWTTAWNKHGVGYANSKDLIHWSQQKLLDVMQTEPAGHRHGSVLRVSRDIWRGLMGP